MNKVYLAMYKGRRDGRGMNVWIDRFVDFVIRTITRSPYSHCEIAVLDGNNPSEKYYYCYSSSARDGGVRTKYMPLPPEKWDLIELPPAVALSVSRLFRRTHGAKYDYLGALGAVLKFPHNRRRWFCSEWCAEVLCYFPPQKYTPARLAKAAGGTS